MNNQGVPGQIISEFGQIAKDVGKQAVQVPKDIAGTALESLGASSGNKPAGDDNTAWSKIGKETDQKIKQSIARKALEELAGGLIQKKREPSIWERLQAEQEQKKQMIHQQTGPSGMSAPLPKSSSKRPAGDLYGAKAKKTATENRNVRQD